MRTKGSLAEIWDRFFPSRGSSCSVRAKDPPAVLNELPVLDVPGASFFAFAIQKWRYEIQSMNFRLL